MNYSFYIISYQGERKLLLKETIKKLGAWFNHFENQYILCSKYDINRIKDELDNVINHGKDKLLIIEIDIKNTKGWLPSSGWDWIKTQKERVKNRIS